MDWLLHIMAIVCSLVLAGIADRLNRECKRLRAELVVVAEERDTWREEVGSLRLRHRDELSKWGAVMTVEREAALEAKAAADKRATFWLDRASVWRKRFTKLQTQEHTLFMQALKLIVNPAMVVHADGTVAPAPKPWDGIPDSEFYASTPSMRTSDQRVTQARRAAREAARDIPAGYSPAARAEADDLIDVRPPFGLAPEVRDDGDDDFPGDNIDLGAGTPRATND